MCAGLETDSAEPVSRIASQGVGEPLQGRRAPPAPRASPNRVGGQVPVQLAWPGQETEENVQRPGKVESVSWISGSGREGRGSKPSRPVGHGACIYTLRLERKTEQYSDGQRRPLKSLPQKPPWRLCPLAGGEGGT